MLILHAKETCDSPYNNLYPLSQRERLRRRIIDGPLERAFQNEGSLLYVVRGTAFISRLHSEIPAINGVQ